MFLRLYYKLIKISIIIIIMQGIFILLSPVRKDNRWKLTTKIDNSNFLLASKYLNILENEEYFDTVLASNSNLNKHINRVTKSIKLSPNIYTEQVLNFYSHINNKIKKETVQETLVVSKEEEYENNTRLLSIIARKEKNMSDNKNTENNENNKQKYTIRVVKRKVNKNKRENLSTNNIIRHKFSKKPKGEGFYYYIKSGDSLWKISKRFNTAINDLLTYNNLSELNIRVGQRLWIPGKKNRGDFIWPVKGRISSGYGYRIHPISKRKEFHAALDIAAPKGTKIVASKSGRISYAGWIRGYGKVVVINHSNGYSTLYAHMSKISVKKGQQVSKGDKIGEVGTTGYSTGPHTHFEIRRFGKKLNPLKYLN